MSDEEDPFAEIKALQKKVIKAEEENTKAINKLNAVINFQHGITRPQYAGGGERASGGQLSELKSQTDLLKQILLSANGQTGKWGDQQKLISGGGGGGNIMQRFMGTNALAERFNKAFKPLSSFLGKIGGAIKGITSKVWGGLKKSGLLPGIFMGIGVAVGAVMAKVISSSPLLVAMLKLFSTGMTLIFRPIGDCIGCVL